MKAMMVSPGARRLAHTIIRQPGHDELLLLLTQHLRKLIGLTER